MTDCGAACLATISKHYGCKIPITQIREVAGTDKQGTNVFGIIKAAEFLGFSTKAVKGDENAFLDGFPLPAIAHVVIENTLHYVVIHDKSDEEIIVADPKRGILKFSPDDFFQIWTGVLILLEPTSQLRDSNETVSLFSRFMQLIRPHKKLIFAIFFTSILYTIFGMIGSFYFKFLIDDILPNGLEKKLQIISISFILLIIVRVFLNAYRSYVLLYLTQKLDRSISLEYYNHVLKLPMKFFGDRKVGEIVSRFLDASKVRVTVSDATLSVAIDSLMAIAGAIILFIQNSFLFYITLLLIPIYAVIIYIFHKLFTKANRDLMEKDAELASYIVESIKGIETIKAYNLEGTAFQETEKRFAKLLNSYYNLEKYEIIQSSLKLFLLLIGETTILWLGATEVFKGNLTVGQLITFNALLAYFLEPIQNLINLQSTIQTGLVASERLVEILDLEIEKQVEGTKQIKPQNLKGDIEFKDINFRYGTRELILKNVNLKINQGEKIALVGQSGSGKTTLIKLLMNFFQNETGNIFINGIDIKDIQLESLREKIAYIPQDTFFFNDTIKRNLSFGSSEEIEIKEIEEIAKLAKIHDFINNLPLQYNTFLEENAMNISGGQRQRLAIARALLRKPDILILDEATSNLDSTTENAISETIQTYCKDITTIIIAHRLSTIKNCNKIFVMDKGEIIESGTHKELLQTKGKYFNLWIDQLYNT